MKSHWRKIAALLPQPVQKKIFQMHFDRMHQRWLQGDQSFPPSHRVKQGMIKSYAAKGQHSILVETGTYFGDMIFAMQDVFENIYSIELSPSLHQRAINRFKGAKNVKLFEGDSGKVLKFIVPTLKSSALFWLDGHYSGGVTAKGDKECPIYEELESILQSPLQHTIIIDDARHFVGVNDYPTIEEIKKFVLSKKPESQFHFENDAIIILSK